IRRPSVRLRYPRWRLASREATWFINQASFVSTNERIQRSFMISFTTAAPAVGAAFVASLVEVVEDGGIDLSRRPRLARRRDAGDRVRRRMISVLRVSPGSVCESAQFGPLVTELGVTPRRGCS